VGHRVLVVDDVKDVAETFAKVLEGLGYESKSITDPRDAVEAACAFKPSVVLLDIGMPHINGYELCPLLREALKPARVRIVAVTAWGSSNDRAHSRAVGFDAHLVKPVAVDVIDATVKELLPKT